MPGIFCRIYSLPGSTFLFSVTGPKSTTGSQFLQACERGQGWENRNFESSTSRFWPKSAVTVWPNPAKTSFTVSTDGARAQLQLVDIAGKIVRATVLQNPVETISTQGLCKSTYLVRVLSNDQISIVKLVVE